MPISIVGTPFAKAAYDWSEPLNATGANVVVVGGGLQPGGGTTFDIEATYAGDACTGVGATVTSGAGSSFNRAVRLLYKTSPTTGSNNAVLTATRGTSTNGRLFGGLGLSGVDISGTPHRTRTANALAGAAGSMSISVASQEGDLIVLVVSIEGTSPTFTASGTGTIQAQDIQDGNKRCAIVTYPAAAAPATSTTCAMTFGGTVTQHMYDAAAFINLVVGPTISVQPAADTVILTNENTATFSVTATGTGSLTYDWELEDGVASGVYANLANGNGATWTGQTAASCTATLTAKTLSGRRVRCNVTDDNGTTTSTAVALTIYDGPTLTTFGPTNGSGVSTATLTSDYVTGVGEAIEVRIPLADGDVAVTVTTT